MKKPNFDKPTARRPDKGLQSQHLMKFFTTSAWTGYDDSPTVSRNSL